MHQPDQLTALLKQLTGPTGSTWRSRAACRGLDTMLFFPGQGESIDEAIAVCEHCPVRTPCAEHAVEVERFGIWGGTSERQRRRIRADRRATPGNQEGAAA